MMIKNNSTRTGLNREKQLLLVVVLGRGAEFLLIVYPCTKTGAGSVCFEFYPAACEV